MYTELVVKCSIKENIDDNVKNILDYLFNGAELDKAKIPDHEFFKCERWHFIGSGSSCYHIPFALSKWDYSIGSYLFSRSDLKDYNAEIEKFIDWIDQYIDETPGMCIGWSWYEEYNEPTLLYKK